MGSIKNMVEDLIPGIYVRSLMIGSNIIEVGLFFLNIVVRIDFPFIIMCEIWWESIYYLLHIPINYFLFKDTINGFLMNANKQVG